MPPAVVVEAAGDPEAAGSSAPFVAGGLPEDKRRAVLGWACAACAFQFCSYTCATSGESFRITRFSAFCYSAAWVKLKLPVITVWLSIIMILLCAMAC